VSPTRLAVGRCDVVRPAILSVNPASSFTTGLTDLLRVVGVTPGRNTHCRSSRKQCRVDHGSGVVVHDRRLGAAAPPPPRLRRSA
jgi:hypothetical protein